MTSIITSIGGIVVGMAIGAAICWALDTILCAIADKNRWLW